MPDIPLDAFDALLRHIYKQVNSGYSLSGTPSAYVCIRVDQDNFRTFPSKDTTATRFQQAVTELDPEVAVKLRSASVQAALASLPPHQTVFFIDAEVRIQVIDTITALRHVEKGQGAAFIRDERALVVWSDRTDDIIESANDFERRLLNLVWVRRTGSRPSSSSIPTSPPSMPHRPTSHHSSSRSISTSPMPPYTSARPGTANSFSMPASPTRSPHMAPRPISPSPIPSINSLIIPSADLQSDNLEKGLVEEPKLDPKRDLRPIRMFGPIYDGLAVGLAFFFVGTGVRTLLTEYALDGEATRFVLLLSAPFFFVVSLFFCITLLGSISQIIGPVAQCHENSRYYSAIPPPAPIFDSEKSPSAGLPHVTIQMPVYKESLAETITPTVLSLQKAMITYARQGGTSSLFICDDGMQIISEEDRAARIAFYAKHRIGWVARPGHSSAADGFKRAGRFKKASNMNYCLTVSLRMEEIILDLLAQQNPNGVHPLTPTVSNTGSLNRLGLHTSSDSSDAFAYTLDPDLEEKALQMAVAETNGQAWAAGGKSLRMGEIVLLVDSDTRVPEDCLRDAARELQLCPDVAIIQHESDAMQVAHHYFENAIAYFTRRVNQSISMACANGEIAPFVGHNAFLRWQAMQEAAFIDSADGKKKFWSEEHVSEDFDMAMRVQLAGYIVRWAVYSNQGFKEGVSLSADDELNRWTKYSYGCNELLFNPVITWWRKGLFAPQIRRFIWSGTPIHYKISMLAYMFSYYGIAASIALGLLNYIMLGFQFHVDAFYTRGFELWLSCFVLFLGVGNISFTIMEYRLGKKELFQSLWENVKWLPFFFVFFGGLSLHLSAAILSHLFSIDISWGATKKEVERSNFFQEVPKILKRFWIVFTICTVLAAGMTILATPLVPFEWRVEGDAWAVILPFAINVACHILYPIVLNPWLMIFSY